MSSSSPALARWRRGAIPFLLVAACATGCGSAEDPSTAVAASGRASSTSGSTTSTSPTSSSVAPPPVRVREVVDGRTIVDASGARVLVSGLAAPGECWAKAAADFATTSLGGKQITLVTAVGDHAGVLLPDGTDFAVSALSKGMARAESTAGSALTSAQAVAEKAGLGLWGGTCKGADTVVPPAPVAPPPAPVAPPVPAPVAPPAPAPAPPASSAYYKNCTAARAAGVTPLHRGEPGYGSHLDRDGDGIACE
ncbi:excalibur calcium-binding domain-containing protein [Umezawaea sp. Da 62-37]|uniref:excalibur calcium-binding domain-containing protein n=1 Tax=Umezawaea sp. Da 62-37 TaxID=3075927 RepID=UPI0028F6F8FF|nr:excalibur calcium-binding domain-containing protein [Umezawaea sp. Da 62-37]WNV91748.1 excalibur calcium-binding domain-containing protein [Umezawaea sp. Da 62-37]